MATNTFVNSREYKVALVYVDDDGTQSPVTYIVVNFSKYNEIYYLTDHLGNIRMSLNKAGEVVGYDDYYPFGEVMQGRSMNSGQPNAINKFNGKELDAETGYANCGARLYDPKIARWLQVDPLADKGSGFSPYNFCFNSPLNAFDPTGEWPYFITHFSEIKRLYGNDYKTSVGTDFVKLSKVENNNFTNKMMNAINILDKTAPKAAEFLRQNSIPVGIFNQFPSGADGVSIGIGKLGMALDKSIFFSDDRKFSSDILHETVHNMGGSEFSAFGASIASGLLSIDEFFERHAYRNVEYVTRGYSAKPGTPSEYNLTDLIMSFYTNSANGDSFSASICKQRVKDIYTREGEEWLK